MAVKECSLIKTKKWNALAPLPSVLLRLGVTSKHSQLLIRCYPTPLAPHSQIPTQLCLHPLALTTSTPRTTHRVIITRRSSHLAHKHTLIIPSAPINSPATSAGKTLLYSQSSTVRISLLAWLSQCLYLPNRILTGPTIKNFSIIFLYESEIYIYSLQQGHNFHWHWGGRVACSNQIWPNCWPLIFDILDAALQHSITLSVCFQDDKRFKVTFLGWSASVN